MKNLSNYSRVNLFLKVFAFFLPRFWHKVWNEISDKFRECIKNVDSEWTDVLGIEVWGRVDDLQNKIHAA